MDPTTEPVEPGNVADSENLGAAVGYGDAEDMGARVEDSEEVVAKYEESLVIATQNEEDQSGEQQVLGYIYRTDNPFNGNDTTILMGPLHLNGQNLILTQNEAGNEIIVLVPSDVDELPSDSNFVLQPQVTSEEALKGHDALVVGEHSQAIEYIRPEEASEEHKERHVYMENSGELLNISNENIGSVVGIESPIWSVSSGAQLKNDGTEMVFIPNPTVVLAPDEMKHRKLMQLACIAHELQSTDQKNSSAVLCDYSKDPESSTSGVRTPPVEAIQRDEQNNLDNDEVSEKPLSPKEREDCMSFTSKSTFKVALSELQVVDNAVSVIHSTLTPEMQGPFDNPPEKAESDLSNIFSTESVLEGCSKTTLQVDECTRGNSPSPTVPGNELKNHPSPARTPPAEVKSHPGESDGDAKDEDSGSNCSLLVCDLSKEIDMSERTPEDIAPNDTGSMLSDIDDDNLSSTHSVSISEENESSFLNSQCSPLNDKQKAVKSSPAQLQDGDKNQMDEKERHSNPSHPIQEYEAKLDDSVAQSPTENLESDLVIVEDRAYELENGETHSTAADKPSKEDSESKERRNTVSADKAPLSPVRQQASSPPSDADPKESNNVSKTVTVNFNSSPVKDGLNNEVPSFKKNIKKQRIRPPREEDDSSSEESPLKTKKLFISRKKMRRSLFETKNNQEDIVLYSDDTNEGAGTSSRTHDDGLSLQTNSSGAAEFDESTLESSVHAQRNYLKNSHKYFTKRKRFPATKQGLRSFSLRSRSLSSALPLKCVGSEMSDSDVSKSPFDPSNSDNIPWGKVLLETSFDKCSEPVNDAPTPSTSFALPKFPKETSTPLLSPEQRRRKSNKYKRDFERLLKPPNVLKQPRVGGKKYSHPNVIRATKSRYFFSRYSKSNSLPLTSNSSPTKRQREEHLASLAAREVGVSQNQKQRLAKISYLNNEKPVPDHSKRVQKRFAYKDMYSCTSCNFHSIYADNLMEHLKYCSNKSPSFRYEVNNMDKRQRIRGEEETVGTVSVTDALKRMRSDLKSALLEDDLTVSQFGGAAKESKKLRKKRRFSKKHGYGEDDVVWVKFKDQYWPALVFTIQKSTACVKLIDYPEEVKSFRVPHEDIRTFDNSKFNLLCLSAADTLPNKEVFVKTVQTCERFISKKFLGIPVIGKDFFALEDEVIDPGTPDSLGNEATDYESDGPLSVMPPTRIERYSQLDLQALCDHLTEGNSDDYVVDIYHKRRHSKKHDLFFENGGNTLLQKLLFGPFEQNKKQQEEVFCHFRDLFLRRIGDSDPRFVSYVCQVMIPEAIVHAISVTRHIPLEEAELLFESEDNQECTENGDPSIEEIIMKYL